MEIIKIRIPITHLIAVLILLAMILITLKIFNHKVQKDAIYIDDPNFISLAFGDKSLYNLTDGQYCIAIGYKAGWDLTDENYKFAFSLPNEDGTWTEYSCEMTYDEYKNVYNVVQRAFKNSRIIK